MKNYCALPTIMMSPWIGSWAGPKTGMPTGGKFYWQVGGNLEEWPDQGVRPHQDGASSYRSVSIAKMFCL